MEQFNIEDFGVIYEVIRVLDPEIYYISDNNGGVICYCIHGMAFRSLYHGTGNHQRMFEIVNYLLLFRHDLVTKASTSASVASNVLGDVSGLISSFIPVSDVKPLMSTSKRVMSSVGAETKRRIIANVATQILDLEVLSSMVRVEFQTKDTKLHGLLKLKTGILQYVAVFFEGDIMGDSWFNEQDQLVASRAFKGNNGISIPIALGKGRPWFNYELDETTSTLYVGGFLNSCQVDLLYGQPGKVITCGHFKVRYLAKGSPLIRNFPLVYRGSRIDIGIEAGPNSWITSNNLPPDLAEYDIIRQNLLISWF